MPKPPSSLCVLPWINLTIRTHGELAACPYMEYRTNCSSINRHFPDARKEAKWARIRNEMLSGKSPSECKSCEQLERIGQNSERLVANRIFEDALAAISAVQTSDPLELIRLDIGFDNKCNLMCPTCGTYGSSLWEAYFTQNDPSKLPSVKFNWCSPEMIDCFFDLNPRSLRQVVISGGEPLFSQNHWYFIDQLIERGLSRQIELVYLTNGTLLNAEFIRAWDEFKSVRITISMDDIEDRYEFMRWPAQWDVGLKNIHTLDDLPDKFAVSLLVHLSAYNAMSLPAILDFVSKQSFKKIRLSRAEDVRFLYIEDPVFLDLRTLTPAFRKQISDRIDGDPRFQERAHFYAPVMRRLRQDHYSREIQRLRRQHLVKIRQITELPVHKLLPELYLHDFMA